MRYVTSNTNLNLDSRKKNILKSPQCIWVFLSPIMLGLLLYECEFNQILLFIIRSNPNVGCIFDLTLKFNKSLSWAILVPCPLIYSIAVTPASCILCLVRCHSLVYKTCALLVANYTYYII